MRGRFWGILPGVALPRSPAVRAAVLVVLATLLAAAANAVSPRGISWSRPLGKGLRAQVVEAGLVPVDLAEVRRLIEEKSSLVLDARSRDDFGVGRLPGAVPFPWPEAEEGRLPAPPAGRPVLIYCANEFCDASLALGRWLRERGHRDVAVFVDGYEAWWNAKGPVDQD